MKPYKCPVCGGKGNVPSGFYDPPQMTYEYPITSTVSTTETCKSCNGQGILWSWDCSPTPDHTPWVCPGDGNTTFPPYEITWETSGLDNTTKPPYEITHISADVLSEAMRDDRPTVFNPRRAV